MQDYIEQAKEQIKRHEGLRLKPYRCSANKLTIGYGRNIEDTGITEPEADILLGKDVANTIDECANFDWFFDLSDNRKIVIINMIYNLGLPKFLGFKKMIQALDSGCYETAAYEMMQSRWANQVGNRAIELANHMLAG